MSSDAVAKAARGVVFVKKEVCKGCAYCVEFCPSKCLEMGTEFNAKGYHYPVLAHPEKCSGCDMCGSYCPDFAIVGKRLKDLEAERTAAGSPTPGVQAATH